MITEKGILSFLNFCYNNAMKKILLILALFLLLVIVAAAIYMHTVFIPVTLKAMIQEQGQELLGRKISYSQLRYSLSKGITLDELKIQQKDNPEETLLSVSKVNFNILLIPLLKDRTVIIPSVTLTNPQAALIRNSEKIWNIADLLQNKTPVENPSRVILSRIILQDGIITVVDQTGIIAPLQLTSINTDASLSLPQSIQFKIATEIKGTSSSLNIQGSYDLKKKSALLNITANSLDCMPAILPLLEQQASFEQLTISSAQLKVQWQPAQWSIQGTAQASLKTTLGSAGSLEGILETGGLTLSIQDSTWTLTAETMTALESKIQTNQGSWMGAFKANGLTASSNPDALSMTINALSAEKPEIKWGAQTLLGDSLRLIEFQLNKEKTDLLAQGQLHIINADLKTSDIHLQGDLAVQRFSFAKQENGLKISAPLILTEAILNFKEDFTLSGPLHISKLDLTQDLQTLTLSTQIDEDRLNVTLADGITLTGIPKIELTLTHAPLADTNPLSYQATLWLKEATLDGIKGVPTIGNIQGTFLIDTNSVQTENLTLKIFDIPAALSGSIRDLKNFQSELLFTAENVPVKSLSEQLQAVTGQELPITSLQGMTDLEISVRGSLKKIHQLDYAVDARLKNVSLENSYLPKPLTNIYGILRYKNDFLSWQDWTFTYDGQEYTSSGAVKDFADPTVNIRLKNNDLTLSAFAKSRNKIYEFSRFDIQGKNSMLKATGTIDLANPGLKAAILAEARLDLSELNSLPLSFKKLLAPVNPRGNAYLKIQFNGPLKTPLDGRFALNYQSEMMRIYGYRIDNLSVDASVNNNQKSIWTINSNLYDGLLNIQAKIDLADPSWSSQIQASLKGADIAGLNNDSPLKDKPMSGVLDFNLTAYGPLKTIKNLTGNGEISVSNGHIWTANLLKGVWERILIQDYRNIDFTGGNSKFQIKDNRVMTNSLFLYSKPLNLEGKGWIDFSKNIDLDIYPDFKMTEILISNDLNKGFSAAMAQTRGFLSIKLYGTIDNPKHKVLTHPEVLLQKGAESAVEGAGVIFEEIQNMVGDMFP